MATSNRPSFQVSIPSIRNFTLKGRNQFPAMYHIFFPPASTKEWPTAIGEMGDSYMRQALDPKMYGPDAIGRKFPVLPQVHIPVLIDGKVYTDDSPFWLSKVKSERSYRVVYYSASLLTVELTFASREANTSRMEKMVGRRISLHQCLRTGLILSCRRDRSYRNPQVHQSWRLGDAKTRWFLVVSL
jgi:hypothetical protein